MVEAGGDILGEVDFEAVVEPERAGAMTKSNLAGTSLPASFRRSAWTRTCPLFQSPRTNTSSTRARGARSSSTESQMPPLFQFRPAW